MRAIVIRYLLPAFATLKLRRITADEIDRWVIELSRRATIAPRTINGVLACLKTMLKTAVKRGLIRYSPAEHVERVASSPRERGILSIVEARAVLDPERVGELWEGDFRHYVLNLTAASTGCRLGELLGLERQYVHPEYLSIVQSWAGRTNTKKEPKWGSQRIVTVPSRTRDALRELMDRSPFLEPDAFVFYSARADRPIHATVVGQRLYRALARVGIDDEERRRRNLTFHSWRHWLNSRLRASVPDSLLRRITGHSTPFMTELYTHWDDVTDFEEVRIAQERLLSADA